MPSLAKSVLAGHVITALGPDVLSHGDTDAVPLTLSVKGLVPLAIYAFTVSDPPGGRDAGELKIQLIAPGQKKGERANLDAPDNESYVVLLGYSADYSVFVLWDAYKHRDFAFSKNCQVRIEPIKTLRSPDSAIATAYLGTARASHHRRPPGPASERSWRAHPHELGAT